MYGTASELYNKFLDKYFEEYYDLEKEKELNFKFKLNNLKRKGYNYVTMDGCNYGDYGNYGKLCNETLDDDFDDYDDYKEEEFIDKSDMTPKEDDDQKVKEGKGLKILTPNIL